MTPQIIHGCSLNPLRLSPVVADKCNAVREVELSTPLDPDRHTHSLQARDMPPNAAPDQVPHSQRGLNSQYPCPKPYTPRRV